MRVKIFAGPEFDVGKKKSGLFSRDFFRRPIAPQANKNWCVFSPRGFFFSLFLWLLCCFRLDALFGAGFVFLHLHETKKVIHILQVPTTQLAKMSIDPKFVELTADVLEKFS